MTQLINTKKSDSINQSIKINKQSINQYSNILTNTQRLKDKSCIESLKIYENCKITCWSPFQSRDPYGLVDSWTRSMNP